MKTHRKLLSASAVAAALSLAGCWGGDDDNNPPAAVAITEVPDSAGVSGAAFVTFVQTLSTSDETSEPLTIKSTFAVPADETSEPTPLT